MVDDGSVSRTDTAPASPRARTDAAAQTIGRFRVERELGAGGMGVVYLAFDPDLERRIALKVLRASSHDAARRLQREAKAMARLAHPNVVTVYEVSSAGGRDYVAMELVEGESLAEWLRAERREAGEVIDVIVAAGRGLAAAHAAGIIHRDFKPHNVLRGKTGRIAVTDFGLAREAVLDPAADPLAITLPVDGDATASTPSTTPSSLAGLTATGAVLGTPAYMAPEQWRAAAVSPATDQFAFCVTLWEALAGERPFRGKTIEELRARIEEGPASLDASRIPRRLRSVLVRGLDLDPDKRWPSMDALLARIAPARSRRVAFAAIGATALVGAGGLALALGRGGAPAEPPCPAPVASVEAVWSPAIAQTIAAGKQAETGRMIEHDLRAWTDLRARACTLPVAERAPRLACLDGVLGRVATLVEALAPLAASRYVDAPGYLLDPAICDRDDPPRLVMGSHDQTAVTAFTLADEAADRPSDASAIQALVKQVERDPCAVASAQMLAMMLPTSADDRERAVAAAEGASEACGDDVVRAEVLVLGATTTSNDNPVATAARLERAEAAARRIGQADLVAMIDALKARLAERAGNLDLAIEQLDAATRGMAARGRLAGELDVAMRAADLRRRRGRAGEVAGLAAHYATWIDRATRRLGADADIVGQLEGGLALLEFHLGDVAAATARFTRAARRHAVPPEHPRAIRGKVVDASGAPVAGATVSVARVLLGSATSAAMPYTIDGSWRETTTAADGSFAFTDAPREGVVVAERGPDRSTPAVIADDVSLALGATSRILGRVELQGASRASVLVTAAAEGSKAPYSLLAPVGADGSFELAGVPRGRVRVLATVQASSPRLAQTTVEVRQAVVDGVVLSLPAQRGTLHVIVRSTVDAPLRNAQVLVLDGRRASGPLREFYGDIGPSAVALARPVDAPPPELAQATRRGDLIAELGNPAAEATACAIALPSDLTSDVARKVGALVDKIEVRCVPVPSDGNSVVIEVPPWPRSP